MYQMLNQHKAAQAAKTGAPEDQPTPSKNPDIDQ
jgi:hypothetical protein